MNFAEHMNRIYGDLLASYTAKLIANLTGPVIRHLQSIKRDSGMMQSPESSGLINLWDEICVQVQWEYSPYWDSYEDYIEAIIDESVRTLPKEEKLMIWLSSESFSDWADSYDEDDNCDDAFSEFFPEGYDSDAIIKTIYEEVISRADVYQNRRITTFIDQDYEF